MIEYGIAMVMAILVGGAAIGGLVEQTGGNLNRMCDELVVEGKTANLCDGAQNE